MPRTDLLCRWHWPRYMCFPRSKAGREDRSSIRSPGRPRYGTHSQRPCSCCSRSRAARSVRKSGHSPDRSRWCKRFQQLCTRCSCSTAARSVRKSAHSPDRSHSCKCFQQPCSRCSRSTAARSVRKSGHSPDRSHSCKCFQQPRTRCLRSTAAQSVRRPGSRRETLQTQSQPSRLLALHRAGRCRPAAPSMNRHMAMSIQAGQIELCSCRIPRDTHRPVPHSRADSDSESSSHLDMRSRHSRHRLQS
jgi:hypothetical protein